LCGALKVRETVAVETLAAAMSTALGCRNEPQVPVDSIPY
jgi:hypothetical protein